MGGRRILVVQGGGRPRGNTSQLVEAFSAGAREAGHEVELVSLARSEVRGCLGCGACRFGRPCVQRDAFNDIAARLLEADCLVLASPLYFWTISARIKAFVERFYRLAEQDPAPSLGRYERYPEKDCALLMTAADDYFWTFEHAVSYYRLALVNYIGMRDLGMVLAGGCGDTDGPAEIARTGHLERARRFGRGLYDGEPWPGATRVPAGGGA